MDGGYGIAERSRERKDCTNLSLRGFIKESTLYAFPPTPSFTVSAPELSADPCLAPCSLRTISCTISWKECDSGDLRCLQPAKWMGEGTESAGEEARPTGGRQGCGVGRRAATSTSCTSIPGVWLQANAGYGGLVVRCGRKAEWTLGLGFTRSQKWWIEAQTRAEGPVWWHLVI
jgi:hypothetical protein